MQIYLNAHWTPLCRRKRSYKKIEAAIEYKPPSNRNRTKCLKIKIVAAASVKENRVRKPKVSLVTPGFVAVNRMNRDCDGIYNSGSRVNGMYTINVQNTDIRVYCEFQSAGYNWIVSSK